MNLSKKLLLICLPFASAGAFASGDGCGLWCGELPNAYFLTPENDSRGNLGLLLEDLGIVHYQPKSIPFYYTDFMEPEAATGSEDQGPLVALAAELGVGTDAVSGALQRLQTSPYGRCLSDGPQAIEAFLRAVKDASLPSQDGMTLAEERLRFAGLCQKSRDAYQPVQVSDPAKPFAIYLDAASAFYAGQYDQALAQFRAMATGAHAWLREASLYMQGRIALNQAQIRFDDWSEPDTGKIDKPYLDQAEAAFSEYLQAYPGGRYAESARGLFRKVHWLSADKAALAADYQAWLGRMAGAADSNQAALDFLDETESKIDPVSAPVDTLWASPALASLKVLSSWRPKEGEAVTEAPIGTDALQAHRAEFAGAKLEAVGAYLDLAHAFWVDKDYAGVIRQTASVRVAARVSNEAYSRLVLRGLALLAMGQGREAENLWLDMLKVIEHPGQKKQAQWLLALTWNHLGRLDSVYAKDSPVADVEIQDFFIHLAKPSLLEELLKREDLPPHPKSLAYFNLVNQWLRHRDFKAAERILSSYPPEGFSLAADKLAPLSWDGQKEDYPCPGLRDLLAALQKSSDSAQALNCFGDFLRTHEWDAPAPVIADAVNFYEGRMHQWHALADYGLPFKNPEQDAFGSRVYTSLDYYQQVINRRGKTAAEDLAYALHRATSCFASSGYNHCGEQDIPKEQRAAWFRKLKSEHKDTRWARSQKYYW